PEGHGHLRGRQVRHLPGRVSDLTGRDRGALQQAVHLVDDEREGFAGGAHAASVELLDGGADAGETLLLTAEAHRLLLDGLDLALERGAALLQAGPAPPHRGAVPEEERDVRPEHQRRDREQAGVTRPHAAGADHRALPGRYATVISKE